MRTSGAGISDEVHERLKQQAERDHRSVNAQILHILEQATDTERLEGSNA